MLLPEPNEALQEVKVGDYYADIKNDDGIFEVQTRSFNRLRANLTAYFETEKVTVVYPILLLSDLYGLTRRRAICEYVALNLTLASARLDSSDGEVRHPRRMD